MNLIVMLTGSTSVHANFIQSSQKRGAKLSQHLDQSYSLAIYPDQIVILTPILREMEELQDELIAATVEL